MDAQLKPQAVLRGRVLDEDLKPAAGDPVERDPDPPGTSTATPSRMRTASLYFRIWRLVPMWCSPTRGRSRIAGLRFGCETCQFSIPRRLIQRKPFRFPCDRPECSWHRNPAEECASARVTGVVLDDAGKPAAHATVKLMASPGTSRKVLVLGMIMPSAPAGAGRVPAGSFKPEVFTIVGRSPEPEMTRVETRDDGNSHVTVVIWEGRDVNGQGVELAPGAAPFQVILSSGFGKVHGTVEEGDGTTVFLVSRESGEILTYRQVECRAGGAFESGSVPAGDYSAVAFDHAETNGLPAADLPAVIASMASTVHVEAGSAAQVDLSVNIWPW